MRKAKAFEKPKPKTQRTLDKVLQKIMKERDEVYKGLNTGKKKICPKRKGGKKY